MQGVNRSPQWCTAPKPLLQKLLKDSYFIWLLFFSIFTLFAPLLLLFFKFFLNSSGLTLPWHICRVQVLLVHTSENANQSLKFLNFPHIRRSLREKATGLDLRNSCSEGWSLRSQHLQRILNSNNRIYTWSGNSWLKRFYLTRPFAAVLLHLYTLWL